MEMNLQQKREALLSYLKVDEIFGCTSTTPYLVKECLTKPQCL